MITGFIFCFIFWTKYIDYKKKYSVLSYYRSMVTVRVCSSTDALESGL